ncbi:MAG TPA: hypothetical protein VI728_00665 [Syntrophales bacterium]|nr:hypothetical protein [Syntrophales bacterium]
MSIEGIALVGILILLMLFTIGMFGIRRRRPHQWQMDYARYSAGPGYGPYPGPEPKAKSGVPLILILVAVALIGYFVIPRVIVILGNAAPGCPTPYIAYRNVFGDQYDSVSMACQGDYLFGPSGAGIDDAICGLAASRGWNAGNARGSKLEGCFYGTPTPIYKKK